MGASQSIPDPVDGVVTVRYAEAGRRLGVSAKTITRMVAAGKLPSVQVNRCRAIPLDALIEYVERQR